jgi:hypothetical protein
VRRGRIGRTRRTLRSTASRFIIPLSGLTFAAQSAPPRKDCMLVSVGLDDDERQMGDRTCNVYSLNIRSRRLYTPATPALQVT